MAVSSYQTIPDGSSLKSTFRFLGLHEFEFHRVPSFCAYWSRNGIWLECLNKQNKGPVKHVELYAVPFWFIGPVPRIPDRNQASLPLGLRPNPRLPLGFETGSLLSIV